MELREYLDYLVKRMEDDQIFFPLGMAIDGHITSTVRLNRGTYVWKLDNRFRNSTSFKLTLKHAENGNAGAFNFVVYTDKNDPGNPSMREASEIFSKPTGQESTWSVGSEEETLFVGIGIPNDGTKIFLATRPTANYRGLDPFWYTGPENAGQGTLIKQQIARYPAIQILPLDPGMAGLNRYFHTNFATNDDASLSLAVLCAEILKSLITERRVFPDAPDRASWQLTHPDGNDREYLAFLIRRLTEQPLNFPDLETLPDRLSKHFRLNFVTPEYHIAPRLQFLIEMLQRDLRGRGVSFQSYQEWENEQLKKVFPENFYSINVPLLSPKGITANEIAAYRGRLLTNRDIELFVDVVEKALQLDELFSTANLRLQQGEIDQARISLEQVEDTIRFLFEYNYSLNSKVTPSNMARRLALESQEGSLSNPAQVAIRDHVRTLVNKGRGEHLLRLFVQDTPIFLLEYVAMYLIRVQRNRDQLEDLMKDVRRPIETNILSVLDKLVDSNGQTGRLTNEEKNVLERTLVDIWNVTAHYAFYILPLAYGDYYTTISETELASLYYRIVLDDRHEYATLMSTYPFINENIELPYVSLKIARNYVRQADRLLQIGGRSNRNIAEDIYRHVQLLIEKTVDGNNPAAQQIVRACDIGLFKILYNLNALGYREDFAPNFRYPVLIALADELARQAVDAGRQFFTFLQQSEQAARGELEAVQAIGMNEALVSIENLRVEEAAIELATAQLQRDQLNLQNTNLDAKITEMSDPIFMLSALATGIESGIGMAAIGLAMGGPVGIAIGVIGFALTGPGAVGAGIVGGISGLGAGAELGLLLGAAKGWAQWKAHESQLHDYEREKDVLLSYGVPIADSQVQASSQRKLIADGMFQIAQLRSIQSLQLATLLQSQFLDVNRMYELTIQMREIYLTHLRYANEMAFLAEQALEYEIDERINRIGFTYELAPPHHLLGAEKLELDLAGLKQARIERFNQKRLPVTISISLREEFPLEFFQFIQHGKATFHTGIEFFERMYPGAYQSRISRIELAFFALVPQSGLHGTLSSLGISFVKNSAGEIQPLIGPPERMIISKFEIRNGTIFFSETGEHYHPFEGMGVATDWTLELSKNANQMEFSTIQDIQLVMHFTTLYNDLLAEQVIGARPLVETAMRSFSLHNTFADSFFQLHQEGRTTFRMEPFYFPSSHTKGKLRRSMLLFLLGPEGSVTKIEASVRYTDDEGTLVDQNLTINLTPGVDNPITDENLLDGLSLYGQWELEVRFFDLEGNVISDFSSLQDILLFLEYTYEPA